MSGILILLMLAVELWPIWAVIVVVVVLSQRKKSKKDAHEEEIEEKAKELLRERGLELGENGEVMTTAEAGAARMAKMAEAAPDGKSGIFPSEEEVERQLEDQSDRASGQNIALYVGSLLIVAGAGGTLMTLANDGVRLIILLLMTAGFYGVGLAIRKNAKLLIAGNAFVGTALAIIPFLGFAFAGFAKLPGEIAWLITSMVGVVAYLAAAMLIRSRVVSYLTIAFMVSLACSMAASMRVTTIWYIVLVMIEGIIFSVVRMFVDEKKLGVMGEAVDMAGRWLTLLAAVVSFFLMAILSRWELLIIFGVATAQLVVVWLRSRSLLDEVLMRIFAQVTVAIGAAAIMDKNIVHERALFCGILMMTLAVHVGIGIALTKILGNGAKAVETGEKKVVTEKIGEIEIVLGGRKEVEEVLEIVWLIGVGICSLVAVDSAWGILGAVIVGAFGVVNWRMYEDDRWLGALGAAMVFLPITLFWGRFEEMGWYYVYLVEMVLTTAGLSGLAVRKKTVKYYIGEG